MPRVGCRAGTRVPSPGKLRWGQQQEEGPTAHGLSGVWLSLPRPPGPPWGGGGAGLPGTAVLKVRSGSEGGSHSWRGQTETGIGRERHTQAQARSPCAAHGRGLQKDPTQAGWGRPGRGLRACLPSLTPGPVPACVPIAWNLPWGVSGTVNSNTSDQGGLPGGPGPELTFPQRSCGYLFLSVSLRGRGLSGSSSSGTAAAFVIP